MTDRTPLVGRGAELDRLDAVLDGPGGPPGVVDLTGAAGIGKSRLLAEACGRAEERGLTVLRGRATEYERHIPFRVFGDAFADLDPELLRGLGAPDTAWAAPAGAADAGAAAGQADAADAGADPASGSVGAGAGAGVSAVDRFAAHRATARLLTALGERTRAGLLIALDD
ncbi:ATP-binding protein, partial [Streptomyces goshikiensis]